MQTKTFYLICGAAILCAAACTVLASSENHQDRNDLVSLNAEALADGEIMMGYVASQSTVETEANKVVYDNCYTVDHITETTCWGNGTLWCTYEYSLTTSTYRL